MGDVSGAHTMQANSDAKCLKSACHTEQSLCPKHVIHQLQVKDSVLGAAEATAARVRDAAGIVADKAHDARSKETSSSE
jgi:hypothetical protein